MAAQEFSGKETKMPNPRSLLDETSTSDSRVQKEGHDYRWSFWY